MRQWQHVFFGMFLLLVLGGCGGGSGTETTNTVTQNDEENTSESTTVTINSGATHALLAWNDLGMHCMDGKDYSVFSILPPYNNLHAQLVDRSGALVSSGVTLSFEAIAGTDGKLNTQSAYDDNNNLKTSFWSYVDKLFGTTLAEGTGLTGIQTAGTTPQMMSYNITKGWWEAEGIPITPYNDDGTKNYYPMVKVTAKNSSGEVLATAKTVLPVSDEMDCRACHGSDAVTDDAKPAAGWVNHADGEKDYKLNILRLHDQKHPDAVADSASALSAKGYAYENGGLYVTASGGVPILCASCHTSNALPNVSIEQNGLIAPLTRALHAKHAGVKDPQNGKTLDSAENRDACYRCHPGAATECLRGAMGKAKNSDGSATMQCQSCHGNMSSVGSSARTGWLDQPNCQSCHQNGQRYTSAIDPASGVLRTATDTRFATAADTPAAGYSLYRFSTGHGGLQCESCHGATHAVYPTSHTADNLLSTELQGHKGTIGECGACHAQVPFTTTGGPHGMHTTGQAWVNGHEDVAEHATAQCTACHGSDYRGGLLSKTSADRSFLTEWGTKTFSSGHKVSCYDCHNGPSGD